MYSFIGILFINNCYFKMKAKHLFYTMALASAFAACNNEEVLLENNQISSEVARPTISNVTLNFGEAESRMSYDGSKFNWVNGDQVAVMLMDQNNTGVRYGSSTLTDEWASLSWSERYHLVDYVHTNYPFTLENGEWKTDANMLEGNYFLVYPAAEFDGKRQAYFDISQQKQIGNTAQSRKDAYAQNQRFVGYARLDAAAGSSTLKAQMTEVLAPVRINIQSNCTEVAGEPLQIRKIVLTHNDFHSQFSIDPTTADYKNWNLVNYPGLAADANGQWNYSTFFNYANYLTATGIRDSKDELYKHEFAGSQDAADYVFNATAIGNVADVWDEVAAKNKRDDNKYYYDEAIRGIVKPLWKGNWSENVTKYIEVYTYAANGEDAYTLASGAAAKLGVVAMIPAFVNGEGEALNLYIYTNKGLVGPVDLSNKAQGNATQGVQTTDEIKAADPRMGMKDVDVIIDDDDVIAAPVSEIINNTDDLKNYVEYYTNRATDTDVKLQITNDVTIDDELAAAIKTMKADKGINEVTLWFKSADNMISKNAAVRLAVTAAQADIMESLEISENVLVQVVNGAVVNMTPKAHNYVNADGNLYILVDEGGILNYVADNSSVGGWSAVNDNFAGEFVNTIVENNGTVNIKAEVSNHAGLMLENNNVLNVEAGAYIQLSAGSKNTLNGVINVAEGARLSATNANNINNYGTIVTKGNVYDLVNAQSETYAQKILPGRVIIDAAAAQTKLISNVGQVIYNVLPTAPVEVANNNYATEGMYIYETSAAIEAQILAKHHITDATINGATLSVAVASVETNLRHLTLNNGSALISTYTSAGKVQQATLKMNANNVTDPTAWNGNYCESNKVVTNGDVTFDNIKVDYNGAATVETILNEGKVTVKNAVEITGASVDLNAVEMTIGGIATATEFKAGNLTAESEKTSKVYVGTNAKITVAGYNNNYITISGQNVAAGTTITGGTSSN